ncbi:MAG: bifunctional hydroxymethylpyrimidine kinase/phosphomethylpyrimidine kinase [Candidatus Odinarchaeum yellowstonii]|uniref:Bifunctional hydroxymethylpyrimidine kinase/phosphomethylpyrimidine kinase n=1 Tax=Odinarchaeota yellowstonii (strain LCB_4) TaxID=1841599 RepID=A0AAF0ICD0_ODILC|nr:MAG: bifunctional hydroxymethylpyrimidine kinase/phosphomethylpyrimidine kinase [Candidatus Odinarchaeum yellowstonii]
MKTALTIAGSDPTSGAGVAADLLTFNSLGVYGFFIITALTSQTLSKVLRVQIVDGEDFSIQMKTVFENFRLNAVKTGVISTPYQAKLIKDYVEKYNLPVIADPVVKASDGTVFSDEETVKELSAGLYCKAALLTPNIIEAERLSDHQIRKLDDIIEASYILLKKGLKAVLIKGGHLNSSKEVFDVLNTGEEIKIFKKPRREWLKIHGTGCVLSAAIAAYTAQGYSITEAVMRGEEYFSKLAAYPLNLNNSVGVLQPSKILNDCVEKIEGIRELNQAAYFLDKVLEAGRLDALGEFALLYSINKPVDVGDVVFLKLFKESEGETLKLSYPTIGSDDFTSRIMLTVKKWLPSIRACLCLPYSEKLTRNLEESSEFNHIKIFFKNLTFNQLNLLEETLRKILCTETKCTVDFIILFIDKNPVKIMVLGESSFDSIYKLAKVLKKEVKKL